MRPWQAVFHYRRAVLWGSGLTPLFLVLGGLCAAAPWLEGPASGTAHGLGALSTAWLVLAGVLFCAAVSFIPVGLFLLSVGAQVRAEFVTHCGAILLCGLGFVGLQHQLHGLQAEQHREVVAPQAAPLITALRMHTQRSGAPPASLRELGLPHRALETGLRGSPIFFYERHGDQETDWRLSLRVPAPGGEARYTFTPAAADRCTLGVWRER